MPSGKRETERKGITPVNTGTSPNSDGRACSRQRPVTIIQYSDITPGS
ncbi:hypothetical protein T08_11943 [Trichinella sp. T8]|nr:hypothetical protein T08_11943 [Trichinella sp. T8]